MPRSSLCVLSIFLFVLGCGSDVPGTTPSKLPPAIKPESPQAPEIQKPVAAAKPDKVGAVATGSTVLALEEPTPDGHNWLIREELEAGWVRLFDGQTLFGW